MQILLEHFLFFFQILLICFFLSLCGFLLKKLILDQSDYKNFEENGLFGFIFVGFIALVINFFLPLERTLTSILLILIFIVATKLNFFDQNKKKLFKYTFNVSLITYIILIYSRVNTPDALLYHLPYSKIINEHKIIIGVSNIHGRFGHISIFQYIASFFNNYLFQVNGVLIPIGALTSYFFIYCFKEFKKNFQKNKLLIRSYFIFLILIFSLYSFNRYSGYGNDSQAHIYYFLFILYLLNYLVIQKSLINLKKLSLICLFIFLIKPFYIIVTIIPLILFIRITNKTIFLRSSFTIFSLSLILMWIIKNFLTTGCLIYPILETCNNNIIWFDPVSTFNASLEGEAWSKDYPNRLIKNENYEQYIDNFSWISVWLKNHFLVIKEKFIPIIIFILFNLLFLYFKKCFTKNNQNNYKVYLLILIMNLFFSILWFLKFPVYRFGLSFIYSTLIFFFYFVCLRYVNLKKLYNFYSVFIFTIILISVGAISKNIIRISNNHNQSISPSVYDPLDMGRYEQIYNNRGTFTHYYKDTACGYSLSPCSSEINEIKKKKYFNYQIYYK
jgi:hypothetical protein